MPFLDEALLAFVYGSAILATLRAGSRLLYMASHEGSIGQMDGPVIRGPADLNVRMLSSTSSSDESTLPTNKSVHSQSCDWTISPLWEVAYSLERAVAFDGKNENEFTDVMEVTPCERPSYNLKHSRNNWRDNGVYKMSLVGYNPSHSSTNRSDHSTGVSVSIGNTHDDGFVPDEETSSCQGEPAECSWIYPRITSKNCSDISSEDEINSISRNLLVLPLKASKNVLITVQNKIRNLVDVWVAHPIYRGWVNSLSNTFAFMGFWVRGCRAWASLVSPMVSPWREMQCARAKDYSMKKLSPASRSDGR